MEKSKYGNVFYLTQYEKVNLSDFMQVRDKVFACLVNRSFYGILLERIPHREFLDLEVVYYLISETESNKLCFAMIQNEQLTRWGIDEEMLYQCAMNNTFEYMRPSVSALEDVVAEMIEGERVSSVSVKQSENQNPGERIHVIMNQTGRFGASVLLHSEEMEKVAEIIEDSFYILPSSINEVLVVPARLRMPVSELSEMVCCVNEQVVDAKEVLSEHIYFYERHSGRIEIAS